MDLSLKNTDGPHIDKIQIWLMVYTKLLMTNHSDVLFGMQKAAQVVRAEALEVW